MPTIATNRKIFQNRQTGYLELKVIHAVNIYRMNINLPEPKEKFLMGNREESRGKWRLR